MKHLIVLFILITVALCQDTTVCCTGVTAQYVCEDTSISPYQCDPKTCTWTLIGCPITTDKCLECDPASLGDGVIIPNYKCTNGEVGGTQCNQTTCQYYNNICEQYEIIERPGYCPVPQYSTTDPATIGVICDSTCRSDGDCLEGQKCCKSGCGGLTCQKATDALVRPGTCPPVDPDSVGICAESCTSDSDCLDRQKCCQNSCSAHSCIYVIEESKFCSALENDCGPEPMTFAASLCPDGTINGPFCELNADGACQWQWHSCPDTQLSEVHPGTCPLTKADYVGACVNPCEKDSNCIWTEKCCEMGCGKSCVAPSDECVVTGYRSVYCLDSATATQVTNTAEAGLATDSTVPDYDACYRCSELAICSSDVTGSGCYWSDKYYECLKTCAEPVLVDPIIPPCAYKTSCGCLGDVDNKCGWCQIAGSVDTADGSKSFITGVCLPADLSDKCSGSVTAGGYGGSYFTSAPTECIDDSTADPSIKDTSENFSNEELKETFYKINIGAILESFLQAALKAALGDSDSDIIIDKILKATVTSDGIGSVNTIVKVIKTDLTEEELCNKINEAYYLVGVPESSFVSCKLLVYTSDSTTLKRQTSSGQTYYHSAVAEAPTTGSAGTLAPIWMMLFAIFLFFRM
jgi:hypothetical protein